MVKECDPNAVGLAEAESTSPTVPKEVARLAAPLFVALEIDRAGIEERELPVDRGGIVWPFER